MAAMGLCPVPALYIFLDKVSTNPASADEEGDPATMTEARTSTFSHWDKVGVHGLNTDDPAH